MAVTADFVNRTLYQQSSGRDRSYPLGIYEFEGVLVGDASGGGVTFQHSYDRNYAYSMEAASGHRTGAGVVHNRVAWAPRIPSDGGVAWNIISQSFNLANESASQSRDVRHWMPISRPNSRFQVSILIEFQTNVLAEIYRVHVWGYYWDHRAMLTDTGPRRPQA